MSIQEVTDAGIVVELGQRVATSRAARNLTQGEFADQAGVARSTVQRIEGGSSIQLSSFVKLLRALDRLDALDAVLPREIRSPLAELEREHGRRRQRVRHKRGESGAAAAPATAWAWGDDDAQTDG